MSRHFATVNPPGPQFAVNWLDAGREPQVAPDPRYPNGMDVDLTKGQTPNCRVDLECPAPRCGTYLVACNVCGIRVAITTAGRRDDPRSARIPCKINGSA